MSYPVAQTSLMAHEHTLKKCEGPCESPGMCNWCDGGLAFCLVCKGAEADLPKDCPGYMMTEDQRRRVQDGWVNFKGGQWVALGKTDNAGRVYRETHSGERVYKASHSPG